MSQITPCISEFLKFSKPELCVLTLNHANPNPFALDSLINKKEFFHAILDSDKLESISTLYSNGLELSAEMLAKYLHLLWTQFGELPLISAFREEDRDLFNQLINVRLLEANYCVCDECPCFQDNLTIIQCGPKVRLDYLNQSLLNFKYDEENINKLKALFCPNLDISNLNLDIYITDVLLESKLMEITDSPYLLVKDFLLFTNEIIDIYPRTYNIFPNICGCDSCEWTYDMHWGCKRSVSHISRSPFFESELICKMTLCKCPIKKEMKFPWMQNYFTNVLISNLERRREWEIVPRNPNLLNLINQVGMSHEHYLSLIKGENYKSYFNKVYGMRKMMFFVKAHNILSENVKIRWDVYSDKNTKIKVQKFLSSLPKLETFDDIDFSSLSKRELNEAILDCEEDLHEMLQIQDPESLYKAIVKPCHRVPKFVAAVGETGSIVNLIEDTVLKTYGCYQEKANKAVEIKKAYYEKRNKPYEPKPINTLEYFLNIKEDIVKDKKIFYKKLGELKLHKGDESCKPIKIEKELLCSKVDVKTWDHLEQYSKNVDLEFKEQERLERVKFREEAEIYDKLAEENSLKATKDLVQSLSKPTLKARVNTQNFQLLKEVVHGNDEMQTQIVNPIRWLGTNIVKHLRASVNRTLKNVGSPYILDKSLKFRQIAGPQIGLSSNYHKQAYVNAVKNYLDRTTFDSIVKDCKDEDLKIEAKRSTNYVNCILNEVRNRILRSVKNRGSKSLLALLEMKDYLEIFVKCFENSYKEIREKFHLRSVDIRRLLNYQLK